MTDADRLFNRLARKPIRFRDTMPARLVFAAGLLAGQGLAERSKGWLRLTAAGELRADVLGIGGPGTAMTQLWRALAQRDRTVTELTEIVGCTNRRVRQVLAEMAALGMVRRKGNYGAAWAARKGA